MSTGAEGVVLLAPAAVAGGAAVLPVLLAAAAVTAVAGAGAVLVYSTGEAVIACGRELRRMAQENTQMQRAVFQAAAAHEQRLFQEEVARAAAGGVELQAKMLAFRDREQLLQRKVRGALAVRSQQRQTVDAPVDALQQLRDEITAANPLPKKAHEDRHSHWPSKVDRATQMADQLGSMLEVYVGGHAQGLFDASYLTESLAEARRLLQALSAEKISVGIGRANPDVATYSSVISLLTYTSRRLGEMAVQLPQRRDARDKALQVIEECSNLLRGFTADEQAGVHLAGLEMAVKMLESATASVETTDFTAALQTAEAVHEHLKSLKDAVTTGEERQRNLTLLLEVLAQHVEPLKSLPELAPRVADWLARRASCEAAARGGDMEAAWQMLNGNTGLAAQAEDLQQHALKSLQKNSTVGVARLSAEVLREMGYDAALRPSQESGGMSHEFVVGTQGTRQIYVSVAENGETTLKFEGYGNESCKAAYEEFYKRLRAKGVEGAWQSHFELSSAVRNITGILQAAGLDLSIEPSEDGVTILASGQVDGAATVDYDGSMRTSPQMWEALIRGWQAYTRTALPPTAEQVIRELNRQRQMHMDQQRRREDDYLTRHRESVQQMRLRETGGRA
jgi:hypothetical protein